MKRITSQEAIELNQNFVKTRTKAIDTAIGKKDAISSWFSLQELKDYIEYVEKEGKAKNITVNGLRVYFGAYKNSEKNSKKKNLATVFFAPTVAKNFIEGEKEEFIVDDNSDVTILDCLNDGSTGNPPSATYPQ